ncbi:MAG TPA: hypothetical protein VFI91_12980 [Longimicrobiaceae bacterium]|nr:hypothetical protein [Longimicrobiaceae bacterium]
MYRTCIFCSADLGTNDSVEEFPVGRSLAFDAWKGRLWAICGRCGRWNLAPIEERWEAVESAEKHFRDSRLRVHSENIGLCKLPDGTRLVRVGEALPGELAAWRYGTQLMRRRKKYLLAAGAVSIGIGAFATVGFAGMLAAIGVGGGLTQLGIQASSFGYQYRRSRRVVHRLGPGESPTGEALTLRRHQLNSAALTTGSEGAIAIWLPNAFTGERRRGGTSRISWRPEPLILEGQAARVVLSRVMVEANRAGASRKNVGTALDLLDRAGGPEDYLRKTAWRRLSLGIGNVPNFHGTWRTWRQVGATFGGERISPLRPPPVTDKEIVTFGARRYNRGRALGVKLHRPNALALEMALHEESERRALEGELAELESAWRDAEEIAAIADALPDDPLDDLKAQEHLP